jgi:hypothetical protein
MPTVECAFLISDCKCKRKESQFFMYFNTAQGDQLLFLISHDGLGSDDFSIFRCIF